MVYKYFNPNKSKMDHQEHDTKISIFNETHSESDLLNVCSHYSNTD